MSQGSGDDWGEDDDDVPAEWAGDVHALRRIADTSRVDVEEAERARRLLCDRVLALAIAVEAPGEDERVALAVGEGADPPHVVVGRRARAGRAYTATVLGRGMNPWPRPIVGFERVRMHLERADLLAERAASAAGLWKDRAGVRHLLERCDGAGARLAREDFAQLAALAPILEARYLDRATGALARVLRAAPHVLRLKRFPAAVERKLLTFWNRFHAVANYTLLATVRGKESFALLDRAQVDPRLAAAGFEPYRNLYLQNLILGQSYVVVRVLTALARAGEAAVPAVKRCMAEAPTPVRWLHGAYALIAIGRRHRRLRGELSRAVGPARLPEFLRENPGAIAATTELQRIMEGQWADRDDEHESAMRRLAEAVARDVDGPDEADRTVGDELSLARLAARPANFLLNAQDVPRLALSVALCAEAAPEDLYFPAAATDQAARFTPEAAQQYARFAPPPPAPVRAAATPGRNDQCPCGSGKKHKRCCGVN